MHGVHGCMGAKGCERGWCVDVWGYMGVVCASMMVI